MLLDIIFLSEVEYSNLSSTFVTIRFEQKKEFMMILWRIIPIIALLIRLTVAKTHKFNLTASWVKANPDGVFERDVIGLNGQWPLPVLRVNQGDRIELLLTNGLGNANTSLHFHGLFQRGSSFMDGPEMVTQCPISPGNSFLYNFTVDQVGTYWYHSHSGAQYGDGLRGAIVVSRPDLEYDFEEVITLSDWYHEKSDILHHKFLNKYNPTGAEPIPQNILMNDSRNITISMHRNASHHLRFINMGLEVSQYVWLEGHNMTVVEVDGVFVEPYEAQVLYIAVGQRISVLVRGIEDIDGSARNYRLMQRLDETMLDVVPDDLALFGINHLVYNDAAPLITEEFLTDLEPFDDFELTTLDRTPLLEDYDYQIQVTMEMTNLGDGINYATFNNVTYVAPKVPTLMTVFSADPDIVTNAQIYGSNTNTFILQENEIIELVVNNFDDNKHPFHLHGHQFQVVRRSEAYENPTPYNEGSPSYDAFPDFPMSRDTVIVNTNGHVVLRFKANNPGVWFFHCHLDWHLEQGLALVLVEAPLTLLQTQKEKLPSNHIDCCKSGEVPFRGNAAGRFGTPSEWLDLSGELLQPPPLPPGFTLKGYVAFIMCVGAALYGLYSIYEYGMEDVVGLTSETEVLESLSTALRKDRFSKSHYGADLLQELTGQN